jgi:DNA repair protein RecO (recombination protein O)
MSYHIYTTDGIILKRTSYGEANVMLYILTEDLGLIVASAQAVRKLSSKLRGAIQEYTLSSISCVKGKNGWRMTNASAKDNFFFLGSSLARRVVAQIVSVLLKMIPGETPNPEIFRTVKTGFEHLNKISEKNIPDFECLIVLRILYHLGYVVSDKKTEKFLRNTIEWNENLFSQISAEKREVIALINKALEASQL